MKTVMKKKQHGGFKVRAALLLIQVLLPIGLYFTLSLETRFTASLIAAAFTLSMAVLVWMG